MKPAASKPQSGRLRHRQFSLATLLALTAIVAALLGWRQHVAGRLAREEKAVGGLERGGSARYGGIHESGGSLGRLYRDSLRGLFGAQLFNPVDEVRFRRADSETVALLADLRECRRLELPGARLSADDIDRLAAIPGLEVLDLTAAELDAAAAERLGGIASLRELTLDHASIDDQALEALARLPRLESLRLEGTQATGEGVAALETLLAQRGGTLSWSTATSPERRAAAAALVVRDLSREDLRIETRRGESDEAIYGAVAERRGAGGGWLLPLSTEDQDLLVGLDPERLVVRNVQWQARDYAFLSRLAGLRDLRIESAGVSRQVDVFGRLARLERLALARLVVGDELLAAIARLPRLEELEIVAPQALLHWDGEKKKYVRLLRFGDASLARLAAATGLRRLAIRDARPLPHDFDLIEGLPREGLEMTEAGLGKLAALERLETLDLSGSAATAAGLMALRGLPALGELRLVGGPR